MMEREGIPRLGIVLGSPRQVSGVREGSVADTLGIAPGSVLQRFELSPDLTTTTIAWKPPGEEPRRRVIDTPATVLSDPEAAGVTGVLDLYLPHYRQPIRSGSVFGALAIAGEETLDLSLSIYNVLHKLVTGRLSIQTIGGPVMLFRSIGGATEVGFGYILYLIALISVNLGVVNLLPFPALDGGHLLFLVIEAVKGSPPSPRVREIAQYIGIFCLLGLMLVVTSYDIFYWIVGGG
jgi:membrane-associated protease RseP (regulator of RpoE activity)